MWQIASRGKISVDDDTLGEKVESMDASIVWCGSVQWEVIKVSNIKDIENLDFN